MRNAAFELEMAMPAVQWERRSLQNSNAAIQADDVVKAVHEPVGVVGHVLRLPVGLSGLVPNNLQNWIVAEAQDHSTQA